MSITQRISVAGFFLLIGLFFYFIPLLADMKPLRLNPPLTVLMQQAVNGFSFLTQDSFPCWQGLNTKAQRIDCLLCCCAFRLPYHFFCAPFITSGSTLGR